MPIGTSKVGALGGLVPGGSETFNAPGTFSIPPGVKKVSITGVGGAGNPGNTGNPGTTGNPGSGGGGGTSGKFSPTQGYHARGGAAWAGTDGNLTSVRVPGGPCNGAFSGSTGNSGSAGSAGNTGSAGNPGQSSSGLGNTFCGGAGGNAGAAGNAGNSGSGGGGGATGNSGPLGTGGSGGNGGGQGTPAYIVPGVGGFSGGGGGGAGATNDGTTIAVGSYTVTPQINASYGGRGGLTTGYNFPVAPTPGCRPRYVSPSCFPAQTTGGNGSSGSGPRNDTPSNQFSSPFCAGSAALGGPFGPLCGQGINLRSTQNQPSTWYTPIPINCPGFAAIRSGGGGGGSYNPSLNPQNATGGGGGGGGGRGNAGNAGGAGGAGGTGGAGTPTTFNCVPVTPGGTAPITVGTPGGQIVISWNPQ